MFENCILVADQELPIARKCALLIYCLGAEIKCNLYTPPAADGLRYSSH